jgi:hypothetical protein
LVRPHQRNGGIRLGGILQRWEFHDPFSVMGRQWEAMDTACREGLRTLRERSRCLAM